MEYLRQRLEEKKKFKHWYISTMIVWITSFVVLIVSFLFLPIMNTTNFIRICLIVFFIMSLIMTLFQIKLYILNRNLKNGIVSTIKYFLKQSLVDSSMISNITINISYSSHNYSVTVINEGIYIPDLSITTKLIVQEINNNFKPYFIIFTSVFQNTTY